MRTVVLLVALATSLLAVTRADAGSSFKGVAYDNPGWKEQEQGDARVLIAPRARPGEVLAIILAPEIAIMKDPATDLDALVRAAEKPPAKGTHGAVTVTHSAGFTVRTMSGQVVDPNLGASSRLYELVSNKTHEVFVAVVSKGDGTIADNKDELAKILASCHPTSGETASSPPVVASAPAPAPAGIPYADTPGKVPGDPEFRPSGHGKAIPAPALVAGAPQGLWWTYTKTGNPTAYGTVFFPDGMALHYYRPGGPNLADLDGMKANQGAVDIGTWSLANGKLAIHFGSLDRAVAFSAGRDADGPFFKAGTEVYRPATPLTAKALAGTWEIHGIGQLSFNSDGTVVTTIGMIGSIHGLGYKDGPITGKWLLDGYLLAMTFPNEGTRVWPVFGVTGSEIVITSRFYMRK